MLWHIGNTTVRTPYRLREALRALRGSVLNGNLAGREQEQAFASFLHENGIVDVARIRRGQDASDLGRKWRVAMAQLGFITPQLTRGIPSGALDPALVPMVQGVEGLTGRAFEITPNGYRLAAAEIIKAQQECFLRSLVSYAIPSLIEDGYEGEKSSPLRFVLKIMHSLEVSGQRSNLSFQEYSLFVQTASPASNPQNIARAIIDYRAGRQRGVGNVRRYDNSFYAAVAAQLNRQQQTLDDYADLSFRYLKATGLFRNSGRGIALVPARVQLAALLRDQDGPGPDDTDYLRSIWQGAQLPTDQQNFAYVIVSDLVTQLSARDIQIDRPSASLNIADLNILRHELENRLAQIDEIDYANQQANCIDEILAWIEAIITKRAVRLTEAETLIIPKNEYPAYLEWVIWRAFLAINSLINRPWLARRFQIDQDFLPVSCAPGGGPDMVFEFENYIIVVEVTLTASSRQEAAEGEPVRRHVARYVETSEKSVYGLFIAVQIDSNTAHTFKSGDWYRPDDTRMTLDIVPITLRDFASLFSSARGRLESMPTILSNMLIECRARANQDAPQWKASISAIIARLAG